jgi:hypothetical protein
MSEEDKRTDEEREQGEGAEHEPRDVETKKGLDMLAQKTSQGIEQREQDLLRSAQEQQDSFSSLEGGVDLDELERLRQESGIGRVPQIQEEVAEVGSRARRAIDVVVRAPVLEATPAMQSVQTEMPEQVPVPPIVPEQVPVPTEVERTAESKETLKDPAILRLERQLDLANSVERLKNPLEKLTQKDRDRLSGALEGRGWHKIFNNLESGEAVVAVMTPPGGETYHQTPDERVAIIDKIIRSGELGDIHGNIKPKELDKQLGFEPFGIFGVKRFNDDFFGPQLTDEIIDKRRELVTKHLGAEGADLTELEQSFKDGFFKLTKDQISDPQKRAESIAKVGAAIEQINAELRNFIPKTIATAKNEIRDAIPEATKHLREVEEKLTAVKDAGERARLIEERKDAVARRKDAANRYLKLHLFEPIFEREGYELNFGVKDVGEQSKDESGNQNRADHSHIELAVAESLQVAKRAREAGEHGREYAETDPGEIVAELKELRERITAEDIIDSRGNSYSIFQLESDGVTKTLNIDIVRDLRKGKFKVREDQTELLGIIQEYVRKVNVLDIVKPYTHEEISGENIHSTSFKLRDQLQTTDDIATRIRTGEDLTPQMREGAALVLEREGKDRTCTSAMEFHSKALQMKNCTYLTLDVLDVGPQLIRDYDRLLQQVEQGKMTFEEVSAIAGDETTRMMRTFREQITQVYREHTGDAKAVPAMLVGGDEATIAIDRDHVEVTDELLMKLRNATSSRVVETVVAGAERASDREDNETTKRKEHLQAQKLAEQGSELAKTLERSVRELRRSIRDLPKADQESYRKSLDALNVKQFVVKQSDSGFKLVVEDPAQPGTGKTLPPVEFQGVLNGVETLNERVRGVAVEAHQKLFAELQPNYPNLSMDVMPRVQHMRNYLEKDEDFDIYMEKYQ